MVKEIPMVSTASTLLARLGGVLCCCLALLTSGCTNFLLLNRRPLIATVEANSEFPVSFPAVLSKSTTDIVLDGFQKAPANQRLRISVVNLGSNSFEMKHSDGGYIRVPPNISVEIYNRTITFSPEMPEAARVIRLQLDPPPLSRTPCEFLMEVENPPQFRGMVKIYLERSNAPM